MSDVVGDGVVVCEDGFGCMECVGEVVGLFVGVGVVIGV